MKENPRYGRSRVRAAEKLPESYAGHEVSGTGWIVFYDQPETAEGIAKALQNTVKHCKLKGNPHFHTFSIVRLHR